MRTTPWMASLLHAAGGPAGHPEKQLAALLCLDHISGALLALEAPYERSGGVCVCVCVYTHTHTYTHIHAYAHPHIHTYI